MAIYTPPNWQKEYENLHRSYLELLKQKEDLKQTLRDQFAMAAIQGMCANPNLKPDLKICSTAYRIADNALRVRELKEADSER